MTRTECLTRARAFIVAAILLTAFSLSGTATAQDTLRKRVSEIVEAEARYDLFSGTVLVATQGRVVYARAFGEENKEYHVPNVLETRFNISSVQKAFVATATMQLNEEGALGLDDPLTKYYPDCPWPEAEVIQIRHLLNHTSGLGEYRDSDEYRMNSERYSDMNDVLPLIFAVPPAFPAGERFRYSNAGVLLLKGIIERVTDRAWGEVLAERIWQPLGMDQTTMFVGGDMLEHRATAYRLSGNGDSYVRVVGEPSAYSGGGIYTTVLDLLKFDYALYGESLLSEETRQMMFTTVAASPNYAFGWEFAQRAGTKVVYHGGGSGGFNSEFRRYPEKRYTLIVLANYGDAAYTVADKIENLLLGLPYALATEADLYYKRAMHLQEQGAYTQALELFERNIGIDAVHLPSLYQAARTRLLGEFEQLEAIAMLDRYISVADESTRPSIAAAWWRKGVAYEQLENEPQAIVCYQQSLELDRGFEYAAEALERLKADR